MFQLELLFVVSMLAQQYYLFRDIQKPNNHSISLDMVENLIASTVKFLAVKITGL